MNLNELKILVAQGEGQRLEFKKKANYPEKIVREISALANAQGGYLILGVDDDGTLSGTRNIEGEAFVVASTIDKQISPRLPYSSEILHINVKKGIAIFKIEEGQNKPYSVKDDGTEGEKRAYIRVKDESLKASREVREIISRRQRQKDIQFEYGDKEKTLMQYLEETPEITIPDFRRIAKISKYVASRTLVRLVLANVLEIYPSGTDDIYKPKIR